MAQPVVPTPRATAEPGTTAPRVASLDGISMTSVPSEVIVPTTPESLDKATNPINGRRGGDHPVPGAPGCTVDPSSPAACMVAILDTLGFNVTAGSAAQQDRHLQQATAVVQLDAGLAMTGRPDDALYRYLGVSADEPRDPHAVEVRTIGTSAQGRPITAIRYGLGAKTVLVVAETHGDEEGGLRVWLRARTRRLPTGTTLWVVPMLNPDGLVLDTRFLANGADPNRAAPAQPEQKAVFDFAVAVRPVLTVWYHQNYGWVGGSGASMAAANHYRDLTQLGTPHRSGDCKVGFMWCPIDDGVGSSSILVELPDVLTPADVQLHADALLTVITDAAP
jgi:Zinc carboxypeptidase